MRLRSLLLIPLLIAGSTLVRSQPKAPDPIDWLAKKQRADGSFHADGELGPAATTGLVLLAFLGEGDTNKTGSHRDVVKSALRFLKRGQQADGSLVAATCTKTVRDHAIAALALSEAYALTGSPLFKQAAEEAVDRLIAWHLPTGGWGTVPGAPGEMETTAWAIEALRSWREARGNRSIRGSPEA